MLAWLRLRLYCDFFEDGGVVGGRASEFGVELLLQPFITRGVFPTGQTKQVLVLGLVIMILVHFDCFFVGFVA